MKENYDVVVVGGGAAGLSGAAALARSRRSVLAVDAGDPRNAPAGHVHNFLSRDGTPPSGLYATGRAEVTGYGGRVETGRVTALGRDGEQFGVQISAEAGPRTVTVPGRTPSSGPCWRPSGSPLPTAWSNRSKPTPAA